MLSALCTQIIIMCKAVKLSEEYVQMFRYLCVVRLCKNLDYLTVESVLLVG